MSLIIVMRRGLFTKGSEVLHLLLLFRSCIVRDKKRSLMHGSSFFQARFVTLRRTTFGEKCYVWALQATVTFGLCNMFPTSSCASYMYVLRKCVSKTPNPASWCRCCLAAQCGGFGVWMQKCSLWPCQFSNTSTFLAAEIVLTVNL